MFLKVEMPAGIDRESTQYYASGHWYDVNNMRFRGGVPEVIGGWQRDAEFVLDGIGRAIYTSRDYAGNQYQFVGTDWKYYAVVGTLATDITPISGTTTDPAPSGGEILTELTDDLTTEIGSSLLGVEAAAHGLLVNDWVVFTEIGTVLAAETGFTNAILEQVEGFQVATVVDDDNYELWIMNWETREPVKATTNQDGKGGTVQYYTRVSSGLSTTVTGNGFGAGTWGGLGNPTGYTVGTNPIAVVSNNVTAQTANPDPTWTADSWVYFKGLVGPTTGGVTFDTALLNDNWWSVTSTASDPADLTLMDVDTIIEGASNSGGNGGGTDGMYYWAVDDPDSTIAGPFTVDGATRGWGDAAQVSEITGRLRRCYIESFGEDILLANSGGPIYYYDTSAKTSSGVPIEGESGAAVEIGDTTIFEGTTDAPLLVESFLISKRDGHIVAFGANDVGGTTMNTMLVRWSDQNNPFDWTPSITNTSGGQVLRVGSKIIGGISTKDEVVIFTNSAVYSMRYLGPESRYVFGFNLITEGVEILSPLVAVNAANAVYFMGNDGFYVYTGTVSPLPSPVKKYVFDDINMAEKDKCYAAVNSGFSEVMWFYPTADSDECNRYVVYNYAENVWSIGFFDMAALDLDDASTTSFSRGAWRDAIVFDKPMATYIYRYDPLEDTDNVGQPLVEETAVMIHESGTAAQFGVLLDAYIETGEIDISDGERFTLLSRIIPDLQVFNNTGDADPVINISVEGRDFPGNAQLSTGTSASSTDVTFANGTYTPVGDSTAIRARARSVAVRFSSSSSTFQWRGGAMRFALQPDGRR